MTKQLNHLAIIMDGNGRWAKNKGLPVALGHKKGAQVAREILIECLAHEINYLTLYTFSSENWGRDREEVDNLMDLLKFYLINEIDLLIEQKIKIKFIGDKEKLSQDLIDLLEKCENLTKDNSRFFLQIALSYGSRAEIVRAQKLLLLDINSGKIKIEQLSESLFESYLYTNNMPDPDLLIRTSGEQRLSNFLLWQSAYSELYFTKTLWPDFTKYHLKRAINNFKKRERRYGL